jgi:hypothetical protein
MKLNIPERAQLTAILTGTQGSVADVQIARILIERVQFTAEERIEIGYTEDGKGRCDWLPEADLEVEVPIGPLGMKLIEKRMRQLIEAELVGYRMRSLVEKFVPDGEKLLREAVNEAEV